MSIRYFYQLVARSDKLDGVETRVKELEAENAAFRIAQGQDEERAIRDRDRIAELEHERDDAIRIATEERAYTQDFLALRAQRDELEREVAELKKSLKEARRQYRPNYGSYPQGRKDDGF